MGQLLFYDPTAIDPRFDDPGGWFNCSGTLVSPTIVVTAGHCTFGTGLNGEPTASGSGGNDVWISVAEEPDYSILPPSSEFIPDDNEGRYEAWSAALNASDEWIRATAYPHPDYHDAAFFEHDLGVLRLSEPVILPDYGQLPTQGLLDELYAENKQQRYTAVGYGLEGSRPRTSFGGDLRLGHDHPGGRGVVRNQLHLLWHQRRLPHRPGGRSGFSGDFRYHTLKQGFRVCISGLLGPVGYPVVAARSRTPMEGASVNGALLEAFRHNSWATGQLLAFCRDLSEEQLAASATGTYGSIPATFNHLVLSDGRYLRRLAGGAPPWVDRPDDADLEELAAWAEEAGQLWERLLSEPVDAERVVVVDDGAVEVRAGVIVAQALHHGNAHREQICATLTSLGIEPPDIQPWEYAWATGRMWERTAAR